MRRLFGGARVARLATTGPAGPHLVPVCFALAGDALYSAVDWKAKSGRPLRRLANIAAEPRVSLLADHYEEDWTRLWWVRADGTARILRGGAAAAAALRTLAEKYPQYRERAPEGPVVEVAVTAWSGWRSG